MKRKAKSEGDDIRDYTPGRTADEITNKNISLAVDLAEKQLREETASPLVIAHYLKLGSPRAQLEKEKMELENELLKAKTDSIRAQQHADEMFAEAIKAMRTYQGDFSSEKSDEYDE